MNRKDAIKILMESPFYFRLNLVARKTLIREFCRLHAAPPTAG